jgi:hypothetical protein
MSGPGVRIAIPDARLSVEVGEMWSLQSVPQELAAQELREGLGSYILHIPTGIYLNVRPLRLPSALEGVDLATDSALAEVFSGYADLSWPGRRTTHSWTEGDLRGVSGVFLDAMPDVVVREWMVTDGTRVANVATFATESQWREMLEDCERVIHSIRFESALDAG